MRHRRLTLLNPAKSAHSNLTGLKLCSLLHLGLGLTGLQAQESINSTGGNALSSESSASYSGGQTLYTTNTGTNGSVVLDVQQPFEISVVAGVEEANDIKLSVSAYPNPPADFLALEVKDFKLSTLRYVGKTFANPKDYRLSNKHCNMESCSCHLF